MADESNENSENSETSESDERDEHERDDVDADTPTEETAAVDDAPAAPVDETEPAVATTAAAAPVAPAAAAAPARERSSLTVPTWAAWVAGLVVFALLLGGSFALGRATGEDDSGSSQSISVPSADEIPRVVPGIPGEGPSGVARAFFGVSVESGQDGVAIRSVSGGSPADDAGFREGDVITKVDGDEVSTADEFAAAIQGHDPGDEVTITYTRDGATDEATVTLGDRFERPTTND